MTDFLCNHRRLKKEKKWKNLVKIFKEFSFEKHAAHVHLNL